MTFAIGDILLKIDTRGIHTVEFNTRHHMMLVVDVSQGEPPIIAHMKFIHYPQKTGQLVIEPCRPSKDIFIIHCPKFQNDLREQIAALAKQAYKKNQLRIEAKFLEQNFFEASQYRAYMPLEEQKMISQLHQLPIIAGNILTDSELLISCHSFVLSTIHKACQELGRPIPYGLNIPPSLGWSDILYHSALQDPDLDVSMVSRYFCWHTQEQIAQRNLSFLSPSIPRNYQVADAQSQNVCVLQ